MLLLKKERREDRGRKSERSQEGRYDVGVFIGSFSPSLCYSLRRLTADRPGLAGCGYGCLGVSRSAALCRESERVRECSAHQLSQEKTPCARLNASLCASVAEPLVERLNRPPPANPANLQPMTNMPAVPGPAQSSWPVLPPRPSPPYVPCTTRHNGNHDNDADNQTTDPLKTCIPATPDILTAAAGPLSSTIDTILQATSDPALRSSTNPTSPHNNNMHHALAISTKQS